MRLPNEAAGATVGNTVSRLRMKPADPQLLSLTCLHGFALIGLPLTLGLSRGFAKGESIGSNPKLESSRLAPAAPRSEAAVLPLLPLRQRHRPRAHFG